MRLTTDDLIGQLVMADFGGTEIPRSLHRLITERRIGGVILFQKNIESRWQVSALCRALQERARKAGLPRLFVAIDQEGGPVERLPLSMPSAMALGATRSEALAAAAGEIAGRLLRAVGANVNFAPVLDVNNNPGNPVIGVRSFGDDPALVAGLGVAFALGLQRQGIIATGKHFPGHGDVVVDSHLDLPVVGRDLARLERVEFPPFRAAVRHGIGALMTAHVAFTHLEDAETPATLAPRILQGLLRERWGFDGVVFTDSLAMQPIAQRVGVARAAVRAILAGADVLCACGGPEAQEASLDALREAVDQGVISEERLRQSVRRLEALRARMYPELGSGGEAASSPTAADSAGDLPSRDDVARLQEMADRAVTVVRDEAGNLPLRGGTIRVVTLGSGRFETTLGETIRRRRPVDERVLTPGEALDGAMSAGGEMSTGGPLVLVTHSRGVADPWQVSLARRAAEIAGDRFVLVATGTPYDLLHVPTAPTCLVTYGREPVMLEAAARVLCGEIRPAGRLPVAIPGLYPAGHGVLG